jgi:hypothetical protein
VPPLDCTPSTGGCAALCRAACESPFNTAPPRARAWLLVEHPGPWPAFGWPSDLPTEAVAALTDAPAHDVRPQLIRRPDRRAGRTGPADRVPDPDRTVLVAGGPRGGRWLERRLADDLSDLRKLDLSVLADSGPPGFGELVSERVLIVCTHGKRDACCARYGAPVARDLAARGLPVWETTHLGGDRFAANLACLPDGTYHGILDRESAYDVAFACLRGEVSAPFYRGTAGEAPRTSASRLTRTSRRRGTAATADTAR